MNTNGVEKFTPSRLVLARERRGTTQRDLSASVGVSDRMIKSYESGQYRPAEQTVQDLARVLNFPISFFKAPPLDPLDVEAASFRSMVKATGTLRRRTLAAGTFALELHRFLDERFDLPAPDLPDLRSHSAATKASATARKYQGPERAAEALRHMWGLGQRPIQNVIHLLEARGVRVFSLSEDCDEIDAFSVWRGGVPFIFLNTRKTAERSIFDAAHELGHLVLHRHGSPQGQEAENEADAFAAGFLLPEAAMRAAAPRMPTIAAIATMKAKWHASVAAIGFRLHELELMSDWHYRHFNIELSRRGREKEPEPLPRETSAVLRKAFAELAEEGVDLREIAKDLCLPVAEVRAITFGLGLVDGGKATGSSAPRGSLRLVRG
ncbi:MAG: ImmA/IrrE family metallo-endopeptidase [Polyangiaceae bacterium]